MVKASPDGGEKEENGNGGNASYLGQSHFPSFRRLKRGRSAFVCDFHKIVRHSFLTGSAVCRASLY